MKKACLLLIFIIVCSCRYSDQSSNIPVFDLAAVKKIIDEKNILYRTAFLKGDSAGFANLHHSETINMPPGKPLLIGKGAIGATVKDVHQQGIKDMIITTTNVHRGPVEVIEEGKFGIRTKNNLYKGKYIVMFETVRQHMENLPRHMEHGFQVKLIVQ